MGNAFFSIQRLLSNLPGFFLEILQTNPGFDFFPQCCHDSDSVCVYVRHCQEIIALIHLIQELRKGFRFCQIGMSQNFSYTV